MNELNQLRGTIAAHVTHQYVLCAHLPPPPPRRTRHCMTRNAKRVCVCVQQAQHTAVTLTNDLSEWFRGNCCNHPIHAIGLKWLALASSTFHPALPTLCITYLFFFIILISERKKKTKTKDPSIASGSYPVQEVVRKSEIIIMKSQPKNRPQIPIRALNDESQACHLRQTLRDLVICN